MKTLKEITKIYMEIGMVDTEIVKTDDLKQEAIKWVKEDIKGIYNLVECLQKQDTKISPIQLQVFLIQRVDNWKDRFNFTEEDLK